MKVGVSTSVIDRGRTGIAQYVFALTRAFLEQASSVEFSLFVLEEDLPLFEFARKTMRLVPVPEHFRPPIKNILWHQTRLPVLARQFELDVLHVPSYRRLLWPKPCALVCTVHDLAPFRVAGKYDWKRTLYARVVAKRLARRQDETIAISQTTAHDLARCFKLPADRVTVIHNGVDHQRFAPAPANIAKAVGRQGFGLAQPFFLYVSRLEHPAKNHVRLIGAFNQFKSETKLPWQLVLAGSDWHGAQSIHHAIRQSPFAGDIRCLGFVSDEDLPMLIRAADVFVYPSLYEGFGLPPIEAMACGCPVICSTGGALGEVVGNAAATVDPTDVSALTRQLARLARDEGLREHLRTAGLERAQQFDWHKTAETTLEVYAQAAARNSTGAGGRARHGLSRANTASKRGAVHSHEADLLAASEEVWK